MSNRLNLAATLRNGIEAVEDIDHSIGELKEQIKSLKDKRKGCMEELKSDGFDPKVVQALIGERKIDPDKRRLYQANLQTCRAMLGMLDGTPLGEAARQAFEEEAQAHKRRDDPDERNTVPEDTSSPSLPLAPTPDDMARARADGAKAARAGRSVTDNPYPASAAELRACYDEGWCSEFGSDGMEIPSAFRRPEEPKKPTDDDPNDEGEAP